MCLLEQVHVSCNKVPFLCCVLGAVVKPCNEEWLHFSICITQCDVNAARHSFRPGILPDATTPPSTIQRDGSIGTLCQTFSGPYGEIQHHTPHHMPRRSAPVAPETIS